MNWNAIFAAVKLPIQILTVGLAVVILLKTAQLLGISDFVSLGGADAPDGPRRQALLAAFLVFLVGIGVGVFAWWLAGKFFSVLSDPSVPQERVASLRELPLALPEGTVRALLALIVGLVGLPILLFSNALELKAEIAGYINGIIMSVFAFYFGTRAGSGDVQTTRQLAGTLSTVQGAAREAEARATQAEGRLSTAVADAERPNRLQDAIAKVDRHLAAAEVLVNVFGPQLPKGLIGDNAAEIIRRARGVAEGAKAIAGGDISESTVESVLKAGRDIVSGTPMSGLLAKAAGALPAIGGLTPIAGVALVVSLGWQLGSREYVRWKARVLAAPYESKLIDFGVITPTSARIRIKDCPIFSSVFKEKMEEDGFFSTLVNVVASDDASKKLWELYGAEGSLFESREQMQAGLDEFRRALLADQSSKDIKDETISVVAGNLSITAPSVDAVNRVIDAGIRADATDEEKAALEALVSLVGNLREKKVDPARLISEVQGIAK